MTQQSRLPQPPPAAAPASPAPDPPPETDPPDLALARAIQQNDKAAVVALLTTHPALVNTQSQYGGVPLLPVIRFGTLEMAKLLLAHGANVNAADAEGLTPLGGAADSYNSSSADMAALLIAHGAVLITYNRDGLTPLHIAANRGNVPVIRLLLGKGVSVNIKSRRGDTPLHIAAATLHPDIVLLLLGKGAQINALNDGGDTPLSSALHAIYMTNNGAAPVGPAKAAMVKTLIEHGAHFNTRDRYGVSPLLYSLLHREELVHSLLLRHHAVMDIQTTFLEAAAQNDVVTLTRLLQAAPLLLTARIPTGASALHVAALWGAHDAATLLLKRGADINARDGAAETPLYYAVHIKDNARMAAWLLAHHADPSAANEDNDTPLHRAVRVQAKDTVNLLLAHHAAVNVINKSGETPLELTIPPYSYTADTATAHSIAALLLAAGADPNIPTAYSRGTLVGHAVYAKSIYLVTLLLSNGASPNGNGSEYLNYDPLMAAAQDGDTAIAALLLAFGADTTAKNLDGDTALSVALFYHNPDIAALIRAFSSSTAHR